MVVEGTGVDEVLVETDVESLVTIAVVVEEVVVSAIVDGSVVEVELLAVGVKVDDAMEEVDVREQIMHIPISGAVVSSG